MEQPPACSSHPLDGSVSVWVDMFLLSWGVVVWLLHSAFNTARFLSLASNDSWLPKSCVALTLVCSLSPWRGPVGFMWSSVFRCTYGVCDFSFWGVGKGWSEVMWVLPLWSWLTTAEQSLPMTCGLPGFSMCPNVGDPEGRALLRPTGRSVLNTLSTPPPCYGATVA